MYSRVIMANIAGSREKQRLRRCVLYDKNFLLLKILLQEEF